VLSGYPTITLLDSARDPMPQTQTDDPVYPVATVTLQPGTPPITPGRPSPGHAYATLRFSPYEGPHGLRDSSAQVLHPSYLTVDGQVISATSADGHPVQSCAGAIQVTAFGSLRTVNTG
jgi:hypothetical protein